MSDDERGDPQRPERSSRRRTLEWWQEPPDGIDEAREDYFDRIAELRAERDRLRAANEQEARDGTR